jgi:flagellin
VPVTGSILTNLGALDALSAITQSFETNNALEQELASGLSINSPADNPAGYITAQGFTAQLNGLSQAISNANQSVSLLQTAQGALQQQIGVVQQLNSIAVQAANGTQSPAEAQSLQTVVTQLAGQVTTIATQTQFNGISLLNGTFSGVQLQVGADEGQTLSLSIQNTSANTLGVNQSTASAGIYGSQKGVMTSLGSNLGAFGQRIVTFSSDNGQTGVLGVGDTSSALSIASEINDQTGGTGISAQAITSTKLKATAGANGFAFSIQAGGYPEQTIDAASVSALAAQINAQTSTSGLSAAVSSGGGSITLTQAEGRNVEITGLSSGSLTASGQGRPVTLNSANASALIQGQVEFQSSGSFSLSGGSAIGLHNTSALTSLSQINVTTASGASSAIGIVQFALQRLTSEGGLLGATQQRLAATINTLSTSQANATSALGVVQDANIPEVAGKLTQAQIQAQAGIAALKNSNTFQEYYLALLP